MIRRTATGMYKVVSEKGRLLSRTNLTYQEAVARLAQVEKYKAIADAKKKEKGDG